MNGLKILGLTVLMMGVASAHATSDDPNPRLDLDPIKKDSNSIAEPDTNAARTVFFPNPFFQLILTPPEETDKQDPGI
ncbi:hypothetical protein KFE98_21300 [bacterium SCSIO 12741]|nr:hypothetical protein KFE98_21300 [bacterium SCSIO 12741]